MLIGQGLLSKGFVTEDQLIGIVLNGVEWFSILRIDNLMIVLSRIREKKDMKILVWLEGGIIQTVLTDCKEEIEFKVMDFDADSVEEDNLIGIKSRDRIEYRVWIDEPYTINDKKVLNHYWKQIEKPKKKKKVKK